MHVTCRGAADSGIASELLRWALACVTLERERDKSVVTKRQGEAECWSHSPSAPRFCLLRLAAMLDTPFEAWIPFLSSIHLFVPPFHLPHPSLASLIPTHTLQATLFLAGPFKKVPFSLPHLHIVLPRQLSSLVLNPSAALCSPSQRTFFHRLSSRNASHFPRR